MAAALSEPKALLVRRWGEMGGYWGINRTMAEIHALLFVSGRPLCTDDVMEQLHVSRGNVSMNLRALVDWGLIQRVHKLGDRKEYFQADTDVWHMFETILRERRRREIEPIVATIERCREMVAASDGRGRAETGETREFGRRLTELQSFLATMSTLFELVLRFGSDGVTQLGRFVTHAAGQADLQAPRLAKRDATGGTAQRAARRSGKTSRRKPAQ